MGPFLGGFLILALAGTIHANTPCEKDWNPSQHDCSSKYKLDATETCTYECLNAANKKQKFLMKFNDQPDYLTIECLKPITSFDFVVGNVKLLHDVKKVTWKDCPLPTEKSLGALFQQLGLTSVHDLSIESNFDLNPREEHFQGLQNIQEFSWTTPHLLEVDPKIARSLSRINTFKIRAHHVELTRDFLAHLRNVRKLVISYSDTLSVENEALDELKSLAVFEVIFQGPIESTFDIRNTMNYVSLPQLRLGEQNVVKNFSFTGSLVENITEGFFVNCKKLVHLDLSSNRISELYDNIFAGLTSLETLNLNNNLIQKIHANAFKNLPFLRHVHLSENELITGNDLLEKSPFAECPSIEWLDLSDNVISRISPDWLIGMKNLQLLDISHNNISSIQSSDIAFTQTNITVNLEFNNIAAIELLYVKSEENKPSYAENSGHVNIILGENPIECKRDSKAFRELSHFLQGKLFISSVGDVKINPKQLTCRNSDGRVMKIVDFFMCPDPCECTENVKDKTYVIDCSKKNLLLAPETLPVIKNFNTILKLDLNYLTELPSSSQKGYEAVVEMSADFNQISKFTSDNILPNLKELSVASNPLSLFHLDSKFFPFSENFLFDLPKVTDAYFKIDSSSSQDTVSASEGIKKFVRSVKNLKTLTIESSSSEIIPLEVFGAGSNLVNISAEGIEFQQISAKAFESAKNLQFLKVSFNPKKEDIVGVESTLDEGLFLKNTELQGISISNIPNLSTIPERIFASLEKLQVVSFVNNGIKSLPDKIFQNNQRLTHIDFYGNQLTSISETLLSGLTNLEVFIMNNNHLHTVHQSSFLNLPNIREIGLLNNQLTFNDFADRSPFWQNSKLVRLYLSHNNISKIFPDWRVSLLDLQFLDLSFNLLPEINYSDLQFKQINDVQVNLQSNQISHIRLAYVKTAPNEVGPIASIDVQNNPMQCDCSAASLAKHLSGELSLKRDTSYNRVKLEHEKLFCDGPSDAVKNKTVSKFVGADIGCQDLTQNCPDSCSCSLDENLHRLVIDCSNLNLQQAPARLAAGPDTDIVLILTGNLLTELPLKTQPGYDRVVDLQVDNNNIATMKEENWLPRLKALEIRNNSITRLSSNLILEWFARPLEKLEFDRSKITHIDLNTCEENGFTIPEKTRLELFVKALEGMTNLEELYLTCAHIEINQDFFTTIRKLKRFTLLQNTVSVITTGAFNDLHDLEKLTLSFKNISGSPHGLFQDRLSLLKGLFRNNNRLQEISFTNITDFGMIEREVFYGLDDLTRLTFSWNGVQNFPENIFLKSNNLVFLDLSHNNLVHISKFNLRGLGSLKELYLNDNQLAAIASDAFGDLNNLETVDLSGNQLSTVSFASTNIQKLFFSRNLFTVIDQEWQKLPKLEHLDLSFNLLEKLDNSDVQFNLQNVLVDLTGNGIKKLEFTYENAVPEKPEAYKTSVMLQENKLPCTCPTAEFSSYLKGLKRISVPNKVSFVDYRSLTCTQRYDDSGVGVIIYEIDPQTIGC